MLGQRARALSSGAAGAERVRFRTIPRLAQADGFALLEVVMALVLLGVAMAAISGLLLAGIIGVQFSRQRTLAEQVAGGQIEAIRQMDYTKVGTTNGDPGGSLPATSAISLPGLKGTQTIQVVWMDDPVPTATGLMRTTSGSPSPFDGTPTRWS